MVEEITAELDITDEKASPNGHDWMEFTDDLALLHHILGKKPAEEIIEVPEWETKVLCRALNADTRIKVQMAAYDEKSKRTDYRNVFALIVISGCFNPVTGNKIFTESKKDQLMLKLDGAPIERLALTILRVSGMLGSDQDRTRKN